METKGKTYALDASAPTAVVTGGSRGIGQAIAATLARDGFQVILTYRSRREEAEAVADAIIAAGGKAAPARLDIGDAADIRRFFAEEIKGHVDLAVLVNNAGITKDGFLVRMKEEDFDSVVGVNLRGTFICTQEAAKIMTKRRKGSIVSISSVVGQMGNAGQANYAAAKAGIIGFAKSCAKELAARQITCNIVAPGLIETDMTSGLGDDIKAAYIEGIPLKRMGTPQDVAEAVAFLASDRAAYITGQVLPVNGGMYC